MTRSDNAEKTFKSGFNCAQSVLSSFADDLKIPHDIAFKISNGFGGGMGRLQEVCGAVTGAIMVLGLIYGRSEFDSKDKQETTYHKVREFFEEFEAIHKTSNCKELLSDCSLLTDEGRKTFTDQNMIEKCYGFVRSACDILEKITETDLHRVENL